jgi:acyl-CoA reductase-like NAD-dependent aldehyde dehydrogenase
MYVDGQWVESESGERLQAINPSNSDVIDTFPKGSRADAQKAIDAASAAKSKAEGMTAYEKSKILAKTAQLLEQNSAEMAKRNGKRRSKPRDKRTHGTEVHRGKSRLAI